MTAAILSIGTELTRGEIANGNGTWLAEQLTILGHEVTEILTVDDDLERLAAQLERISHHHRVIVATGGLGPTTDDLTRDAVAHLLKVPLERHSEAFLALEARLALRGRGVSASNARQAELPLGATVLGNAHGTAPGFSVDLGPSTAFFMPGVPREMRPMFHEQVVPRLPSSNELPGAQVILKVFGLAESTAGDALSGLEAEYGVLVGYRVHLPDLDVKVLARDASIQIAQRRALEAANEAERRLGCRYVYGRGQVTLPGAVGRLLLNGGQTLAVAESCTGGLVSELITQVPGASGYFRGGAIAYSNSAKTEILGISAELIEQCGAVSETVARAMAVGIRQRLETDYALALTGVAGPDGGSEAKPVGLVYCALSDISGERVARYDFSGTRAEVQRRAAFASLAFLREALLCQTPQ